MSPADHAIESTETVRPRRVRRRGRFACFLGLLLGIGGFLAGWLGALWISFDVFAQFTLQFVVISIAFLIGMFMPFARVLTASVIAVLGLLLIGILPHIGSGSPIPVLTPPPDHRLLRVMSFNSSIQNTNVDAIAAEIARVDPDILVMIEFGPEKNALLAQLKPRLPHQDSCLHLDSCHIAVFAKFPIADFESHSLWRGPPVVRATFGPELGGLTVIGTHTIRFPHQRVQLIQLAELADLSSKFTGPRIVAGDLNATPFSRMIATFEMRSRLNRLTSSWLPTWPANWQLPQLAIDHIFASPEIKSLEGPRIGENAGSDHYPVIVQVAIPTP